MTCPNCEQLRARLEKAEQALGFYADQENWESNEAVPGVSYPIVRNVDAGRIFPAGALVGGAKARAYFAELAPKVPTVPDPETESEFP